MAKAKSKKPLGYRSLQQAYGDVLMQRLKLGKTIKIWKNNRMVEAKPMELIKAMSPSVRRKCGLTNLKNYRPPKYQFL